MMNFKQMSSKKTKNDLDDLDFAIINQLKKDARSSSRKIAKILNIAPSTVISRIKKLERMKIVRGYTITLDYLQLGYNFPVIIDVKVSKGQLFEVEKEIAKNENVIAVYDITGEFDVTVLAVFRLRKDLDKFIKDLQRMQYVERTYTKLILNTIKELPSMTL